MLTRLAIPAVVLAAVAVSFGSAMRGELKPVSNITLNDVRGEVWRLHDQKGKVFVVAFLATECPMSNSYLPVLNDIVATYRDKDVAVLGIVPDPEAKDTQLVAHSKEYELKFPLFRDHEQAAVAALGPKVTPEVVVLDDKFLVRYRGRIDDRYTARLKAKPMIEKQDLVSAIDEILAGQPVTVAETKAFGCPITLLPAKEKTAGNVVTYYQDVLPVLQKHCQSCHRAGQVGLFELTSYKNAAKWAELCLEEVKAKRMPPWKPAENALLAGERSLPPAAIKVLENWVAQGLPAGNPLDAPAALQFSDDWTLGEPDLILESPGETTIAPSGPDRFQVQVFPTNLTEDKYIVSMEVKPGNPRVVHHTVQLIDTLGIARKLQASAEANRKADEVDSGPGYPVKMGVGFLPNPAGMLGGWAPGMLPKKLPEGVGQRLPKGADICVQFHYHRTGKLEKDRTRIGLYFAKKPVDRAFYMLPPAGLFWSIPAGAKDFKIDSSWKLNDDVTVHRLVPHMHLIGKEIELLATPPGGTELSLIHIPVWDYNWQEQYELKEPLSLRKGTILRVRATFDNSADNPQNPSSPPRVVMLGEQTTNEMCFVFVGVASERLLPPLLLPVRK